jgi:hypothetical protein
MEQTERTKFIETIRNTPKLLRDAVDGLSPDQLNTPYREGGWTPAQVVHHIADSHIHAFIRTKFILTEDHPTLTPYDQAAWAKHPDATSSDLTSSLNIIDGLHHRWAETMSGLTDDQWKRAAFHPERGELSMDNILEMYSWHGPHHIEQITNLRKSKNW